MKPRKEKRIPRAMRAKPDHGGFRRGGGGWIEECRITDFSRLGNEVGAEKLLGHLRIGGHEGGRGEGGLRAAANTKWSKFIRSHRLGFAELII